MKTACENIRVYELIESINIAVNKTRDFFFNKNRIWSGFIFNKFGWVCFFIFMSWGCAGRTPQPIMSEQSQDSSLTCSQLEKTFEQIMVQINGLYSEGKSRRKNTRVFDYLSYIFPPATLFKDFRKADKVEIAALNKRHNHLVTIAREKGCKTNKQLIPHKQHCKDFFTLGCVLPKTESNE